MAVQQGATEVLVAGIGLIGAAKSHVLKYYSDPN